MIRSKVLLAKLSKLFPKKYAKANHDFVGLMVGRIPETINKIALCLDLEWSNVEEILKFDPDLVITHHPFFFGTKSFILRHDESKKELYDYLISKNINVYSMHTNFDTGKRGMNDALSEKLGLKNIVAPEQNIMMRVGELENPMEIKEFSKFAKINFNVDYSLLINKGSETIKKVGIIGGGGARSWKLAQELGCDIYISGDAPHYVRREISNAKFNYLDMPHEIEQIFIPQMAKLIKEIDSDMDIFEVPMYELPKVI